MTGTRIKMMRVQEVYVYPDGRHTETVKRRIIIESNEFDSKVRWSDLFDTIADTVKRQENNS